MQDPKSLEYSAMWLAASATIQESLRSMSADIFKSPGLGSRAVWPSPSSEIPRPRCRSVRGSRGLRGVQAGASLGPHGDRRSQRIPVGRLHAGWPHHPLRPTASHMGVPL